MGGGASKHVHTPDESDSSEEAEEEETHEERKVEEPKKEKNRQVATATQSLKKIIQIEKFAPRKVQQESDIVQFCMSETDPSQMVEVAFSFISQTGYYPSDLNKLNQDSVCVFHQSEYDSIDGTPPFCFYGVFDGHGKLGDRCSRFASEKVLESFVSSEHLKNGEIEIALRKAFIEANKRLHAERAYSTLDDSLSGTTAVVVVLYKGYLYCANTGDSRAIACLQAGTRLITEPLSIDQTPFREDERERCREAGARVMTIAQVQGLAKPETDFGSEEDNSGDPPRIWLKQSPVPGTAFSRSIGDRVAESVGVFATPEIYARKITSSDRYVIVASDGVFEFLPSSAVCGILEQSLKYKDMDSACHSIVFEAYRMWLQYEVRTDDISAIVVDLQNVAKFGAKIDANSHVRNASELIKRIAMQEEHYLAGNPISKRNYLDYSNVKSLRQHTDSALIKQVRRRVAKDVGSVKVDPHELDGYMLPEYPKEDSEMELLRHILSTNFLFSHLSTDQLNKAILAMEQVVTTKDQIIVKQFEDGDKFYVAQSGLFSVEIADQETPDRRSPVILYDCSNGKNACFGELALMYSKPRSASVISKANGKLWALERKAFRSVCLKTPYNSMLRVLKKVNSFADLDFNSLCRLMDEASHKSYKSGEYVVRQGEIGSEFFVIESGHAEVTLNLPESEKVKVKLSEQDCFGEQALIYDRPRNANVKASGPLKCMCITKELFEDVLGNAHDALVRERAARQRIAELVSNGMSAEKLQVYEPAMAMANGKMFRCQLQEHSEDGERFATLRVVRQSEETKLTLVQEQELIASISSPTMISVWQTESFVYQLFKEEILLPVPSVLRGIDQIKFSIQSLSLALIALHEHGICHRTLVPEAVFIDAYGDLKLMSFEHSKRIGGNQTFTICGNPNFLAPEVVTQGGYGLSSDWWSLGVLLLQWATGKNPFEAKDEIKTFDLIATSKNETLTNYVAEALEAAQVGEAEELKSLLSGFLCIDPTKRTQFSSDRELETSPLLQSLWIGDEDFPFLDMVKARKEQFSILEGELEKQF